MTEWPQIMQNQQRLGVTQPKPICIDLQPVTTTQALDRDDILNVGGFSNAGFDLVASFIALSSITTACAAIAAPRCRAARIPEIRSSTDRKVA